jgi:ABC-type lipoprotein release transport system permease subunit
MTWHIPVAVLGAVLLVCALAAALGILRVSRVDPASVFR